MRDRRGRHGKNRRWERGKGAGPTGRSAARNACRSRRLSQFLARHLQQLFAYAFGALFALPVDPALELNVLPAGDRIGRLLRQQPLQQRRYPVGVRYRGHVGRRALQHHDVPGFLGHLREQRHRGRARADDDDFLAAVVEVLGPVLRMDDLAPEVVAPLNSGR